MSRETIDSKVVEMRFDNQQFESNVKQSLGTLDKLKEKLNFPDSSAGLDKISKSVKNIDFDPISKGLEAVGGKFKFLQDIASGAAYEIGRAFESYVARSLHAVTIEPLANGWAKYEEKTNAVQTILKATGKTIDEVNKEMEKLQFFADETSYSFSDMTNTVGKFVANGVELEKSTAAVQGISTWAAMSGQNAKTASRAFYNLAQAVGVGKVKAQDWISIEGANMATDQFKKTVIETAAALGELDKVGDHFYTKTEKPMEVTAYNLRETLKDSWFTSEVLISTLNQYGSFAEEIYQASEATGLTASRLIEAANKYKEGFDGFKEEYGTLKNFSQIEPIVAHLADQIGSLGYEAYLASQEAKTLTDAIDSVKDATSTAWMSLWETLFGDYTEAKKTWTDLANDLYEIFVPPITNLTEIFDEALNSTGYNLKDKLGDAKVDLSDLYDQFSDVQSVDDFLVRVDDLLNGFVKIQNGSDNATETLGKFGNVVAQVFRGDFGNGIDRYNALTEAGYDYYTIQNLVNDVCYRGAADINLLTQSQEEFLNLTEDQRVALLYLQGEALKTGESFEELIKNMNAPTGRELFIGSLQNIVQTILSVITDIRSVWQEVFPPEQTAKKIYDVLNAFNKFTTKIRTTVQETKKVQKVFKALFSILDLIEDIVRLALNTAFEALNKIFSSLNEHAGDAIDIITDFIIRIHDWIKENKLLERAFNAIANVLDWVIKKGASAVKTMKEWVSSLMAIEPVKKILDAVRNAFIRFGEAISGIGKEPSRNFTLVVEAIREAVQKIKDWFIQIYNLPAVQSIIKTFKDTAVNAFNLLGETFDKVKEKFNTFFDNVNEKVENGTPVLEAFGQTISQEWENIKEKLKGSFDLSTLFGKNDGEPNILKTLFSNLFPETDKLTTSLASVNTGFDNVFSTITDNKNVSKWLGNINGVLDNLIGYLSDLDVGKILSLIAVWKTSKLIKSFGDVFSSSMNKLASSLSFLNDFGSAAKTAATALDKYLNAKSFANNARSMLLLSAAILALAGAAYVFTTMDWDSLKKGGVALGALVVAISALMAVMHLAKVDMKQSIGVAGMIAALGAALVLAASAFKSLNDVTFSMDQAANFMLVIFGITSSVIAISKLAGSGGGIKAALTMVALGYSLGLVVKAFESISNIKVPDGLEQSFEQIERIVVAFVALLVASSFTKASSSISLIAVPLSMYLFLKALEKLGEIDIKNLINRILPDLGRLFLLLITVFISMRAVSEFAGQAGIAMVGLAGGIFILVEAIKVLTKMEMDPGKIAAALIVIIVLVQTVRGLVKTLGKAQSDLKGAIGIGVAMLGIAAAMGVLVAAVVALSLLDNKGMTKAALIVGGLMLMMSQLVKSTGQAGKLTGQMASLTALVVALSGSVVALSLIDDQDAVLTATACIILMIKMIDILAKGLEQSEGAWKGLISVAAVIGVLGLVMWGLAELPAENTLAAAGAITSAMLGLGVMMLAVSALSKISWEGLFVGIGKAAVVIGLIAILIAICGVVATISGGAEFVQGAMDILAIIGKGLGNCVGYFVGGVLAGASEALPHIAENLSTFMTNLDPFLEGCRGIKWDVANGAAALAAAIVAIGVAQVVNAISNICGWFGQKISGKSLTDTLGELAKAVKNWADKTAGINPSDVSQSANAAKTLIETMKKIPRSGGVVDWLFGGRDFAGFSKSLSSFGVAILGFNTVLKRGGGINPELAEQAAAAGKAIASLEKSLAPSGGKWQNMFGDQDLGTFSVCITAFGSAMNRFNAVMGETEFNEQQIAACVNFARSLVGIQNALEPTGGVLPKIFSGDTDLATFGTNLQRFGSGFKDYADAVANIQTWSLIQSTEALRGLVEILTIADTIKPGTFSGFGYALKNIAEASIKDFTDSFANATEDVKTAAKNMMQAFINAAETKNVPLQTEANTLMTAFNDKILAIQPDLETSAQTLTQAILDTINSFEADSSLFSLAGAGIMKAVIEGLESEKINLEIKGRSLMQSLKTTLEFYLSDFADIGYNVVKGFADSISLNTWIAEEAAKSMARSSAQAARNELAVQSPSKVFAEIGRFAVLGYVNSFFKMEQQVKEAGESMANSSLSGTRDAIQNISQEIQNGINDQPTIRPVLDLSEVNNGIHTLDGLFSTRQAVSIGGLMSGIRPAYAMASAGGVTNNTPTFNIYQQPGENAEDLARRINKIMGGWYK